MIATFKYVDRESPIHRLDPGVKVIFLVCFLFSIILFWDLRTLAVLMAIAFSYYFMARLPWSETRGAWTFVLIFSFLFAGINGVIFGGGQEVADPHVIWSGPLGLEITWEKLYHTAAMIMRILSIAAVSLPLTFTTRPQDYGVAFRGIGLPDKIAVAVDLSLRLVPTFGHDFQATVDAQRARGYETEGLRGGYFAKLRRMAPLLVPVTINAIVSGEDIANAMDMRAFGTGKRTWSRTRRRNNWDRAVIAFGLLMLIASAIWALTGHGGEEGFWIP